MGEYLIDHIDKGLGIVPKKMPNNLSLVAIGEDGRDQGDTLICGEGTNDQALPHRDSTGHEKLVRQIDVWFQS